LLEYRDLDDDARLWHDKDLYRPVAVVRAAILAALHRSNPAGDAASTPVTL
jgi:hypothetical protein